MWFECLPRLLEDLVRGTLSKSLTHAVPSMFCSVFMRSVELWNEGNPSNTCEIIIINILLISLSNSYFLMIICLVKWYTAALIINISSFFVKWTNWRMITSTVWTDGHKLLMESNWTGRHPRKAPITLHPVQQTRPPSERRTRQCYCSLFSGSLALEALLIGVRYKKRYINV